MIDKDLKKTFDDKMTLGEKVKSLRKYRDMSRQELANAVGISLSYITKIENNERENVSNDLLDKLGQVLRINSNFFKIQENIIPQDFFQEKLPKDILEIILSKDSHPYLYISQKAKKNGITPKQFDRILEALIDTIKEK